MIDLRSDTITKPTDGMRKAMYDAEVGDDVYYEDPTVNRLQERVADLLGKQSAIWVSSGTMGNLLSVKALTLPGDEIILEADSHIVYYEGGGTPMFCGVQMRMIPGERGVMTPMQVEHAVRGTGNAHFPRTSLVCIENTHNRMNGAIQPLDDITGIRKVCDEKGLAMHMDGARLMNASVASGISPKEYSKYFETVTICFSKGLGAPMGSMVAGDEATMQIVHRYRKLVGGGQRQVGVVAAAALYALDHHVERLAEDHENARRLALALADMKGVGIDPDDIDTNIVYFDVTDTGKTALDVVVEMANQGVMMLPLGDMSVRCVTHLGVDTKDIDTAINAFAEVFGR